MTKEQKQTGLTIIFRSVRYQVARQNVILKLQLLTLSEHSLSLLERMVLHKGVSVEKTQGRG